MPPTLHSKPLTIPLTYQDLASGKEDGKPAFPWPCIPSDDRRLSTDTAPSRGLARWGEVGHGVPGALLAESYSSCHHRGFWLELPTTTAVDPPTLLQPRHVTVTPFLRRQPSPGLPARQSHPRPHWEATAVHLTTHFGRNNADVKYTLNLKHCHLWGHLEGGGYSEAPVPERIP